MRLVMVMAAIVGLVVGFVSADLELGAIVAHYEGGQ